MKVFSSILVAMFFAGCSWLNVFDGNISQNNWRIQKIIVNGKEYLSPQALKLKEEAQKDTQDNSSDLSAALAQNHQKQDTQGNQNTEENQNTKEDQNNDSAITSEQNTLLSDTDLASNNASNNGSNNEASNDDSSSNGASNNTSSDDSDDNATDATNQNEFTSLNEISTMTFDPSEHRIYGIAACNNYFASYAWKDDDHIEIANSGITRKLCSPDELMSFEFQFMRGFSGTFAITKNKTSMILDNGKMQIYLQAISSK